MPAHLLLSCLPLEISAMGCFYTPEHAGWETNRRCQGKSTYSHRNCSPARNIEMSWDLMTRVQPRMATALPGRQGKELPLHQGSGNAYGWMLGYYRALGSGLVWAVKGWTKSLLKLLPASAVTIWVCAPAIHFPHILSLGSLFKPNIYFIASKSTAELKNDSKSFSTNT